MAYLKAMLISLAAALILGAGIGARGMIGAGKLPAPDKATLYSQSISEGIYCAAFFTSVLVPAASAIVFVARRLRRRS